MANFEKEVTQQNGLQLPRTQPRQADVLPEDAVRDRFPLLPGRPEQGKASGGDAPGRFDLEGQVRAEYRQYRINPENADPGFRRQVALAGSGSRWANPILAKIIQEEERSPRLPNAEPHRTERPRVGQPNAEQTAPYVERALQWQISLERFVAEQGPISRHEALQRAALLLSRRYSTEDLSHVRSGTAQRSELAELGAVIARAEELQAQARS
jgi:hypothetical protein